MELILMMIALFAIMYFLMIRPQQKRMKADQEMRSSLAVGDRVLLTSGIFATISHLGERQFIVELAPDIEVTILKGNVARKVEAADEEFEFTDEIAATEPTDEQDAEDVIVPDDASWLTAPQSTEAPETTDEPETFDPTPAPGEGLADEQPRTEDNK
ncbi:preprotein translocase subunit YajC [Tessaracoccus palaemonis]|uniref:Preprotein translocase subunit YajC n=1 Tax=Tessaracoccus palaemonis TaxID=2829499 RepID=A0ABX8SLA5_9ACTN|nr:preprotein translocase subunit YajC [Tessaracoccus palaemonis]QXT64133.1 preprotein translocase subunit YajC [Tessaracoccus palaemonis]